MTEYNPTVAVKRIREHLDVAASKHVTPAVARTAIEEFAALDEWLTAGGRIPAQWGRRRLGRKPIAEDGWINPDLTHSQHGTRGGYNTGCKCIPCRAANRGEDKETIQVLKEERGWA